MTLIKEIKEYLGTLDTNSRFVLGFAILAAVYAYLMFYDLHNYPDMFINDFISGLFTNNREYNVFLTVMEHVTNIVPVLFVIVLLLKYGKSKDVEEDLNEMINYMDNNDYRADYLKSIVGKIPVYPYLTKNMDIILICTTSPCKNPSYMDRYAESYKLRLIPYNIHIKDRYISIVSYQEDSIMSVFGERFYIDVGMFSRETILTMLNQIDDFLDHSVDVLGESKVSKLLNTCAKNTLNTLNKEYERWR